MDHKQTLKPGIFKEISFQVQDEQCAQHIGSGTLPVLATPVLVTTMEVISRQVLDEHLAQGSTSVGISMEVRHLAPTPRGSTVHMHSEIQEVDGSKVTFQVRAWDEVEDVFEGQHQRAVIDVERFLRRVAKKTHTLND